MDYSILRQEIIKNIKNNPTAITEVKKMSAVILNKTATYNDVYRFADKLGQITGAELEKAIASLSEENLEDLAVNIINPVYRNMQATILSAGKSTQRVFNARNGLGLNPADVNTDEDRLKNIENRFKTAAKLDEVKFLTEPYVAKNIAKSSVTDTVKRNADNFNRAGLDVYYIRSDGAGCCDWCSTMVGKYTKDDIPDDFWRVHKGCSCTFEYKVNGTHAKIRYSTDKSGKMSKETEDIE